MASSGSSLEGVRVETPVRIKMLDLAVWSSQSYTLQDIKDRVRLESDGAGYGAYSASHTNAFVTDELIHRAQQELGQMYMDKRQWKKATMHFVQCKQTEQVVDCLFRLGDYDKLLDLQTHCTDQFELHEKLARSYQSVGMCSEACASYIKVFRPGRG